MKYKYGILLVTALILGGILRSCASAKNLTETIDVGIVLTADIVPTSFNEAIKTTIKTDKGVFTVRGLPSVFVGDTAKINKYDNGSSYLCLSSWDACYRVQL